MSSDEELAAFVSARLDEKRQYAEGLLTHGPRDVGGMVSLSGQMLREVEADRRILDLYTSTLTLVEHPPVMEEGHPYAGKISARDYLDAKRELAVLRPVVEALAGIHREHPGWRPEWTPE